MPSQADKASTFRALHERPGAFVIPNPWDAGTAKLLAAIGLPGWAAASPGEPIPGDGSLVLGLLGYALPLIVVALALAILVVTERLTRRWRAAR